MRINVVLVDAVIDNIPLILARNLEYRVVGSAIDLQDADGSPYSSTRRD